MLRLMPDKTGTPERQDLHYLAFWRRIRVTSFQGLPYKVTISVHTL